MKKSFFINLIKTTTLASLLVFSACSKNSKLEPDFPDRQDFTAKENNKEKTVKKKVEDCDAFISLDWVGNAYPLETSKTMVGTVSRFVIPYTRKTSLLKMTIENKSNSYVEIEMNQIRLIDNIEKKDINPLSVNYFKTLWPTFAVKSQDMLIDQSFAIGDVIRTIARDKSIMPKSTYSGYLAFPRLSKNVENLAIKMRVKAGKQYSELIFEYTKNEKN